MSGGDEGGPWVFGFLQDNNPPALLRDLQSAQSPEEWAAVLGRAVDELAVCHPARPEAYETQERRWAWEVTCIQLKKLVVRGFQPQSMGRRSEGARANHDAHVIAVWGKCRTQADAMRFLQTVYQIPQGDARSRVRRAVKAGLCLATDKVIFGRKSPP